MKSLIIANTLVFIGVMIVGVSIGGVEIIHLLGILFILVGGIITGQLDERRKNIN